MLPISFCVLLAVFIHCLDGQRSDNSRLNFFDTDLLRYATDERKGNVVISPASIKSTLAMILEGAGGATAAEIRSALRLSPDKEEYREQLNWYLTALQNNSTENYIQNANGIFVSDKHKLLKQYELMIQRVYLTEIIRMNFKDPFPSADVINRWIKNKTHGLIPSIVEPVNLTPTTDMLLVNVLYFKSNWQHSFNTRATRGACFHHLEKCRHVAMMELQAELNYVYVENLRAHALELPYEGGIYSMILLVPQEREGLPQLIRDLPHMSLPQIYKLLEPADVTLMMPRFTVDYSEDVIAPLRDMRITSMFSPTANLSGIFEDHAPQINSIFHRVHLTVDEKGTVAAAATAAMVIPLMQGGVQLRVDRPFAFFIRDNKRGFVLFEGKIEEPSEFIEEKKNNGISNRKVHQSTDKPVKRALG